MAWMPSNIGRAVHAQIPGDLDVEAQASSARQTARENASTVPAEGMRLRRRGTAASSQADQSLNRHAIAVDRRCSTCEAPFIASGNYRFRATGDASVTRRPRSECERTHTDYELGLAPPSVTSKRLPFFTRRGLGPGEV